MYKPSNKQAMSHPPKIETKATLLKLDKSMSLQIPEADDFLCTSPDRISSESSGCNMEDKPNVHLETSIAPSIKTSNLSPKENDLM